VGLVYFLTAKGYIQVSDTMFSEMTALSIIKERTWSIKTTNDERNYCYKSKEGKSYSKYGIGLPLLLIPYVLAAEVLSFFVNIPSELLRNFFISFYNIFFGVGSCLVMYSLVRFFENSWRKSLLFSLLFGFGTMTWHYSVSDFSEATQMFFLMTSVYFLLKNTDKELFLSSVCYGVLILLKVIYLVYLPILISYTILKNWPCRKKVLKKLLVFLPSIVVVLLVLFILNYVRFGSLLEFGYGDETWQFSFKGVKNLFNLIFSLDKGLFIYNPILFLSALCYFKFLKFFRREASLFLLLIIVNLFLTASWHSWEGGWSWGPRLMVPMIPFWLIPLFLFSLKGGPIKKIILGAIIFISVIIQLVSVLQRDQEYKHIRYVMLDKEMQKNMPADIFGMMILLKHKILVGDNVYHLTEFGLDSADTVDTSSFGTFKGLDLWYFHLQRLLDKPVLTFIPIVFLPLVLFCFIRILTLTRLLDSSFQPLIKLK
jgi:hypothetical protein